MEEIKKRLEARLQIMKDAKTPTELAFTIWTKELEEAMRSSRDSYRNAFVGWIEAYRDKKKPKEWTKYKTPTELAEAIWEVRYDRNEEDKLWFGSLRSYLVEWINDYCCRS